MVKRQRLLDGANWKESIDSRARSRGLIKEPCAGSYAGGPKLFRVRQLAEQAGVTPELASEVVRRLRREGHLPPKAGEAQAPVGLNLQEARMVVAALYQVQGTSRMRGPAPFRRA